MSSVQIANSCVDFTFFILRFPEIAFFLLQNISPHFLLEKPHTLRINAKSKR